MSSMILDILRKRKIYSSMDNFVAWVKQDFVNWLKRYFNYEIYWYNKELAFAILDSLLYHRMNIIVAEYARQMGKTRTSSFVHSYCARYFPEFYENAVKYGAADDVLKLLEFFRYGYYVCIFAPTGKQAEWAYRHTRNTMNVIKKNERWEMDTSSMSRFELPNGSWVRLYPASKGTKINAPSAMMCHVDEAQWVNNDHILSSIYPMGTAMKSTMLLTGTPSRSLIIDGEQCDYFYHKIHDQIKPEEDPVLKGKGEVIRFIFDGTIGSKCDKDYYIKMKIAEREMGRDSDEFRTSYLLEWLVESISFTSIEKIIALENISKDRKLTRIKTKTMADNGFPYENIYAGLDVGQNPDPSVLTIGELVRREDELPEIIILDWLELSGGMSYKEQAAAIYDKLSQYALRVLSIDVTGQSSGKLGSAFMDLIKMEFNRHPALRWHNGWFFKPVHMSQHRQHELWQALHELWVGNQVLWSTQDTPEWRNFRHQFEVLGYEYRNGYLRCDHPKKEHNDYPVSLALLVDAIGVDFKRPEQVPQRSVRDMVRFSGGGGGDRNPFGAVSPGEIPGMGDGRRPEQF